MFNEELYSILQDKLERCFINGTFVGLEDGANTVLAAYLIGANDGLCGEINELDLQQVGFELVNN